MEKLTEALGITPNELLSGELKSTSHIESDILGFLDREERLNVELAHGQYDNPLDEEECLEYELQKLQEYISDYVHSEKRSAADLYPLKNPFSTRNFKSFWTDMTITFALIYLVKRLKVISV